MKETSNNHLLYLRNYYMHRFFKHLENYKTHIAAYEATEADYESVFGLNKYKDYASFRVAKSRYMSQLKTVRND